MSTLRILGYYSADLENETVFDDISKIFDDTVKEGDIQRYGETYVITSELALNIPTVLADGADIFHKLSQRFPAKEIVLISDDPDDMRRYGTNRVHFVNGEVEW